MGCLLIAQTIFDRGNVWDPLNFFFEVNWRKQRVLTLPAGIGGVGRGTREPDSIFSTLGACRTGHGSRARARPRGREPGPITSWPSPAVPRSVARSRSENVLSSKQKNFVIYELVRTALLSVVVLLNAISHYQVRLLEHY